jgi:hypothetical protein
MAYVHSDLKAAWISPVRVRFCRRTATAALAGNEQGRRQMDHGSARRNLSWFQLHLFEAAGKMVVCWKTKLAPAED